MKKSFIHYKYELIKNIEDRGFTSNANRSNRRGSTERGIRGIRTTGSGRSSPCKPGIRIRTIGTNCGTRWRAGDGASTRRTAQRIRGGSRCTTERGGILIRRRTDRNRKRYRNGSDHTLSTERLPSRRRR